MIRASSAAYLHLFRIAGPYLKNRKGKGTHRRERKAGTDEAQ
jgi:hypothetical protein